MGAASGARQTGGGSRCHDRDPESHAMGVAADERQTNGRLEVAMKTSPTAGLAGTLVAVLLAPCAASGLLALLADPAVAATHAQNCEGAGELAGGKAPQCPLKAESKFTKTGDATALTTA